MILFGRKIPFAAALLIWGLLWEIVGQSGTVFIIPPLSSVLISLFELVQRSNFHAAAWLTLKSFSYGMGLAVVAGIGLGFLMGRVETANRLLGMWVNIFASAPLSALVPVLMLLFGLGETTIVVTVFLFAVWIITLDTFAGVRHVNASLLEMGSSFGATRWQLYSKLIFWAALPEILAGIRLGLIRGVKGVVIGQLLVSVVAFGRLFATYSRNFMFDDFWALAIVMFAFALGLSGLIGKLEQRVEYYAGTRD
ncbi:MAG: ABC transporter permease subunit [Gammaproteobacteria bacterium]|jgi:NitT/TauT family transport system permease protein